jgi:ribosomal protein S18 acetylase RimI-like enzyme
MVVIAPAVEASHFGAARELLAEMARWDAEQSERLLQLSPDDVLAFFHSADPRTLTRQHSPPHGCLLIATVDGVPAGCAAFRRLDDTACELHHLWVRSAFRGRRIARSIVEQLIDRAAAAGYRTMRLETAPFMTQAHALYASLGFRSRGLYREVPPLLQPFTLCMERPLIATPM